MEAYGLSGLLDRYLSCDPPRVWMLSEAIWSAAGIYLKFRVENTSETKKRGRFVTQMPR